MKSVAITTLVTALLFTGCTKHDEASYKSGAEKEYLQAKADMAKGRYGQVAMNLDKFSANHPYSRYVIPAELLRIFAAYKDGEFVLSETLSRQFIERHPTHDHVDYAKYMLAMSFYKERSAPEKDATMNKNAIDAFKRLLKEHPNSEYARDGESRLQSLYNSLAKHELTVGKFYFDRDRFVAAANRFQEVVRLYQTTPSIEEALYYLAASYAEMDLKKDAHQTALLLRHNYPNSSWSAKAGRYL